MRSRQGFQFAAAAMESGREVRAVHGGMSIEGRVTAVNGLSAVIRNGPLTFHAYFGDPSLVINFAY